MEQAQRAEQLTADRDRFSLYLRAGRQQVCGRFIRPGRASAASISMLISLAPLRENVYLCEDEVFRSDIVSAVVPVFRGQAGQRERCLICRKPVFCFRAFVIRECC